MIATITLYQNGGLWLFLSLTVICVGLVSYALVTGNVYNFGVTRHEENAWRYWVNVAMITVVAAVSAVLAVYSFYHPI